MRLRKFKSNRKGVSSVKVTLLLITTAVASSILAYVWGMGLIGEYEGSGGEEIKHQLSMVAYQADSDSSWTLHFINVGNTDVTISAVYVKGIPVTFNGVTTYNPGEIGTLTLDVSGVSFTNGLDYTVKIVTSDGALFPFTVNYGSNR